jgi:hypothetical protein
VENSIFMIGKHLKIIEQWMLILEFVLVLNGTQIVQLWWQLVDGKD